jgi:hypothetical protein
MLWRYFDATQCRQGVEACCDCDVVGAPAGRQIWAQQRGEHDDERLGSGAGFEAQEDGAPFAGRGFAGAKRLRARGQIFVAVLPDLFVCLLGSQVGVEPGAAIACGGVSLRVLMDSQGYGALRDGQLDPVSATELWGAGYALWPRPRGLGTRMVGEGLLRLGDLGPELRQVRVPGVSDCWGTHRMPPPHVAAPLIREPLGPLLLEEVHVHGPLWQQFFPRGLRHGRNVMEPLRREGCDLLALDPAPVADAGDRADAKPGGDLGDLCRQGLPIVRMAGKDFDRDRRAVRVAEEADDDLTLALLAIALRAKGRQGVWGPCPGAPRDLIQKEVDRLGRGALGIESVLAGGWGSSQPIQVLVQRLLIKRLSAQHITSGMRHRQRHGREACTLLDPPSHDWPQCELPCPGRPQRLCDPHASRDVVPRPDRTKGHALLHRDRVLEGVSHL